MADLRLFIAIEVPGTVTAECQRAGRKLALQLPRGAVRWVRPEHMHLTLRFLGDTPAERLPAIREVMDEIAGHCPPFELTLGGLGCFPNRQRPRVIWVGLDEQTGTGDTRLVALKRALDAGLAPLGWEPETKPFRAHLTLGRVKDDTAARGIDLSTAVQPLIVPVAAIQLIESVLRPAGPVYTVRHTSSLAPA